LAAILTDQSRRPRWRRWFSDIRAKGSEEQRMSKIIADLNTLFETAKTASPEEQRLFCRIAAVYIEYIEEMLPAAAAKGNTLTAADSSRPLGAACPGGRSH
jgi:hypothetical protein